MTIKLRDKINKKIELMSGTTIGSLSRKEFLTIEAASTEPCRNDFYKTSHWDNTKKIFLNFKNYTQNKNTLFYVLLLPAEFQIDKILQEEILKMSPQLEKSQYNWGLQQQMLKSFLKENKIAHLDLLPFFQRASKNNSLYKLRDTHFNDRGNLLAAQEVAHFIKMKIHNKHSTD